MLREGETQPHIELLGLNAYKCIVNTGVFGSNAIYLLVCIIFKVGL